MKTEELRRTIGGLLEALPELESIELTHGGQRYRAYIVPDRKRAFFQNSVA